ncbi:hypothetical protein [Bacillus cereus group sp. BfR-BA-01380]|nr:hypothetical protein [Bacillus cereus group sp. BfR-BA-01380]
MKWNGGKKFEYIRISSKKQSEGRQLYSASLNVLQVVPILQNG